MPRTNDWIADEPGLNAWHRWTDLPLTLLAGFFLAVYATQVLYISAAPGTKGWLEAGIWVSWALFVGDYLTRFALARRKLRFLATHPFDGLVLLLPMLRALRVVTVVAVLNRRLARTVRHRIAIYSSGVTALLGLSASLAVLDAERNAPDATITTFGDAVWWTLTTITTVGYGDRYPVTGEGRLVAGALMVGGIALLGVVTGLVASWFVRVVEEAEEETAERAEDTLRAELAQLRTEIRALTEQRRRSD